MENNLIFTSSSCDFHR